MVTKSNTKDTKDTTQNFFFVPFVIFVFIF